MPDDKPSPKLNEYLNQVGQPSNIQEHKDFHKPQVEQGSYPSNNAPSSE